MFISSGVRSQESGVRSQKAGGRRNENCNFCIFLFPIPYSLFPRLI
ncbi:MAG: hypothetical protein ACKO2Z_08110 [Sphaerospermopsis kisseleviana]